MSIRLNLKLAAKLPIAMIATAMVVGVGIGLAAYMISLQTVGAQRDVRMDASVQSGLTRIKTYFDVATEDLKVFATRPDTAKAIDDLTHALERMSASGVSSVDAVHQAFVVGLQRPRGERILADSGGAAAGEYDIYHKLFHPEWRAVQREKASYDDIKLFNNAGLLVYSTQKDEDFLRNFAVGGGPLADGPLGTLVQRLATMPEGKVGFADFTFYAAEGGVPKSFVGTPVFSQGRRVGSLIFSVPSLPFTKLMADIQGLGATGEAMLVGSDGVMRTQSKFQAEPNVLIAKVTGTAIGEALAERKASGVIEAYGKKFVGYAEPFHIDTTTWVVASVQTEEEIFAPVTNMRNMMMMVGSGLLLGAALLGFLFSRSLTRPIAKLTHTMKALAEGQLDVAIDGIARRDELGDMSRTVEVFRENAQRVSAMTEEEKRSSERRREERATMMRTLQGAFGRVVNAAQQGDFTQRVTEEFPDKELNEIALSINNLVDTVERGLADTGQVLAALAHTDLTKRVEGDYEGAFADLKSNTNAVAEKLTEIVGQLRATSQSLRTATGEILSGSNDLSERTTKQAAAIEETSAAIEQLTATVLDNAQRAREASDVAATVTSTAEEGGAVMVKVTDAMARITTSSNKISNIIGLIDDIAFQTNLLALNASVEAARAGEAGKGFAVVAIEVRRLAQSAAQASSEVKGLIEQSGTDVSTGSKLVVEAAQKLEIMLTAARSANTAMSDIAQQSREQASSIEEVSTAVRQMDEMTQHNAALVEETNAAIENTEAQTVELDRIVDVFTIETTRVAAPVVARSQAPARPAMAKAQGTKPTGGVRALQERAKAAAKSYLRGGTAAAEDWTEFLNFRAHHDKWTPFVPFGNTTNKD